MLPRLTSVRRAWRLALFGAVVVTAVPVVAFSVALALAPQPTDFMCFWSGAELLSRGQDPYDPQTWSAAVDGLFPNWLGLLRRPPCPGSYGYPLWTALATLPLGILPLRVAAFVWMLLLVGGIAAGLVLLARSARLSPTDPCREDGIRDLIASVRPDLNGITET